MTSIKIFPLFQKREYQLLLRTEVYVWADIIVK